MRGKPKSVLVAFAALSAAMLAAYGWNQYTLHNPNREHAMTELTKSMKTVCFGRYLVDIPAQAEFSIATATIESVKIENVGTSANERIFMAKVERREAELRAAKHETEGTRLREALDINGGKQRLFVYRYDEKSIDLNWLEIAVRSGMDEWVITKGSVEKYVPQTKQDILRIASQLNSRLLLDIPQVPGTCIQNGLLTGNNYRTEELPFGFSLKPNAMTFGISSITAGKPEARQTLWNRVAQSDKLTEEFFNAASKTNKILRHAEVIVDGRKGQEHISTFQDKGEEFFNADAEIYGDATPKQPYFEISMEVRRPINPDPNNKEKPLSNEEALAVWDAVLKTIRPRPGAF